MPMTVVGLVASSADLTDSAATIQDRAGDVMRQTGQAMYDSARSTVPVVSGDTRDSLRMEARQTGTRYEVEVYSDYHVAGYLTHGTAKMSPQWDFYAETGQHIEEHYDRMADVAGDV